MVWTHRVHDISGNLQLFSIRFQFAVVGGPSGSLLEVNEAYPIRLIHTTVSPIHDGSRKTYLSSESWAMFERPAYQETSRQNAFIASPAVVNKWAAVS